MALDALTSRRDFMLSAAPVLLDGRPLEVFGSRRRDRGRETREFVIVILDVGQFGGQPVEAGGQLAGLDAVLARQFMDGAEALIEPVEAGGVEIERIKVLVQAAGRLVHEDIRLPEQLGDLTELWIVLGERLEPGGGARQQPRGRLLLIVVDRLRHRLRAFEQLCPVGKAGVLVFDPGHLTGRELERGKLPDLVAQQLLARDPVG